MRLFDFSDALKSDACLPCEILFSQKQETGKLGRVLNNCIISAFWIPLPVDDLCQINTLPTDSILCSSRSCFLLLKSRIAKLDPEMENTATWLFCIRGLLSQKSGNIVDKINYLKKSLSWKGNRDYIIHFRIVHISYFTTSQSLQWQTFICRGEY